MNTSNKKEQLAAQVMGSALLKISRWFEIDEVSFKRDLGGQIILRDAEKGQEQEEYLKPLRVSPAIGEGHENAPVFVELGGEKHWIAGPHGLDEIPFLRSAESMRQASESQPESVDIGKSEGRGR